jgi:CRP/FNR family transcriptional regulator, cyclic AMP receptor protein
MNPLGTLLLGKHPWLAGLTPRRIEQVSRFAREVRLPAGQVLFSEGEHADRFWLIWEGRIALTLELPGRGTVLIETLGPGDCLGWSWLFPPYRWRFGAVTVHTARMVEIEGPPVRALCDEDADLSAAIHRRVSAIAVERLQATRLRLLDLYSVPQEDEGTP